MPDITKPFTIAAVPTLCPAMILNAPEVFADPAFVEWLNGKDPKFTWHTGGQPTEWSDVTVLVEPSLNGEGSDSEMPEHIWNAIVDKCREVFKPSRNAHIMVRLTNLA